MVIVTHAFATVKSRGDLIDISDVFENFLEVKSRAP